MFQLESVLKGSKQRYFYRRFQPSRPRYQPPYNHLTTGIALICKLCVVIQTHVAKRGMVDTFVVLCDQLFAAVVDELVVLLDSSAFSLSGGAYALLTDYRMTLLLLTKSINSQKKVAVANIPLAHMDVVL